MAEELYLRLFRELNTADFESSEANAVVGQLGPPARVLRSLARARRHSWSSARKDLRAAIEDPRELAPIVEFVAGVGLFVARDYDLALTTLMRAAGRGKPGITKHARVYALRFARALGWAQRVRELEAALGDTPKPAPSLDGEISPELAADQAYAVVFEQGPNAAAISLDALLERHPSHPAVLAARIRLDLLCDRLEDARARLSALDHELLEQLPGERAALALAFGDAKDVTIRTTHHREAPRLAYLRARALASLGEIGAASKLLEAARIALPGSVAIVLALALTRHQQAPNSFGEALERRFEDLLERAPALLSDAAAELEIELWTDQGPLSDRAGQVEILTRAQQMLTAEADLVRPSYTRETSTGEVRLRHVVPNPMHGRDLLRAPAHLQRLHSDDRELIDHIDGALARAIGVNPPRPVVMDSRADINPIAEPGVWKPRALSPEQIEQFLIDGFLIVPKAFDRSVAQAWRDDANRRLREEPEKWVRGYDPNDKTRSLLNYSPDDPSTWTWGRVDLDGPLTVSIEQFAPKVWAVICDLLGGPERIKTRTWTNYLIINFCADSHLGIDAPKPHWNSWHIDDPSPMTRLDRLQNGLVGITLLGDLHPKSGNTWIVPDSVARVARELAAHPEGVDFVTRRGPSITNQCERFHEVVGEAGDVLLMHPLMMHSSSPNRSGRIRWMGNPMVYLNAPLDPFRPVAELSPVELAIHQAIK